MKRKSKEDSNIEEYNECQNIFATFTSCTLMSQIQSHSALVKIEQGGGDQGNSGGKITDRKLDVLGPNGGWPSRTHQLLSKYI